MLPAPELKAAWLVTWAPEGPELVLDVEFELACGSANVRPLAINKVKVRYSFNCQGIRYILQITSNDIPSC